MTVKYNFGANLKRHNLSPAVLTLAVLTSTLLLSGCSYDGGNYSRYTSWTGLIALQQTERDSGWALDPNANVYLVSPAQGVHDLELEAELIGVFQRYFPRTKQSQYRESLTQSFVSARLAGMDYVVYPRVRALTDQQSLGSVVRGEYEITQLRRGEAQMEILIYSSQGEELVDHLKLKTKGSIFTADSRQLIWPPLEEYLRALSQFNLARR